MEGGSTGVKRRRGQMDYSYAKSYDDNGNGTAGNDGTSSVSSEPSVKAKKRFVWPDDLHRDFVAAIFDVGLKCASPKTILELMSNTRELTADHIKSHLQKYRLHRERAREEFINQYGQPQYNPSRIEQQEGAAALESLASGKGLSRPSSTQPSQLLACANASPELSSSDPSSAADPLRAQMGLIRECLQMQTGFQNVLRQALVTQQQLQSQLQAHLQAIGLDPPTLAPPTTNAATSASAASTSTPSGRSHFNPGSPLLQHGTNFSSASVTGLAIGSHLRSVDPIQESASSLVAMAMGQRPPPALTAGASGSSGAGRGMPLLNLAKTSGLLEGGGGAGQMGAAGDHAPAAAAPHAHLDHGGGSSGGHHMQQHGKDHHHHAQPDQPRHEVKRSAEEQMQEEMREHMDLHRQLVLRRNAQVSMYEDMPSGGGASSAAAHGSGGNIDHPPLDLEHVDLSTFKWNDDDDHLFSFLMDPAG